MTSCLQGLGLVRVKRMVHQTSNRPMHNQRYGHRTECTAIETAVLATAVSGLAISLRLLLVYKYCTNVHMNSCCTN